MTSTAILSRRDGSIRSISVLPVDDGLLVTDTFGKEDVIAWWRLFRGAEEGTTTILRRIDEPGWELRLNSGAAADVLSRVGQRPLAGKFRRLATIGAIKVWGGLAVLLITLGGHLPAAWTAQLFGEAAQARISSGAIASGAIVLCNRPDSVAEFRDMARRLDPQLAPHVRMRAYGWHNFVITALPGHVIVAQKPVFAETSPEELAALLAHELAHVRANDAIVATVRKNGLLDTFLILLQGEDNPNFEMLFSSAEEAAADRTAIKMLLRARIPIAPAAAMFERQRVERASSLVPRLQSTFHFGIEDRAAFWRQAAQRQGPIASPFTQAQSDTLFNACWVGPLPTKAIPVPNAPR